ncbi:hypothetical protein L3Y34_016342 [Caenorhabditis briggsae]|uniref:Uncharacterized protein n=1 Tax=Caenorhabditis briggsae TaxID=6238 RepID=A0AAE9J110_CAEBR|nr:hypothetical protein L3Y34_016342 [Caenorhabditis briggsae]
MNLILLLLLPILAQCAPSQLLYDYDKEVSYDNDIESASANPHQSPVDFFKNAPSEVQFQVLLFTQQPALLTQMSRNIKKGWRTKIGEDGKECMDGLEKRIRDVCGERCPKYELHFPLAGCGNEKMMDATIEFICCPKSDRIGLVDGKVV